jgi:nicotinamide phosphoribosyltransferase
MASEHSTTTVYGKENEAKAYENFIDNCPNGILSLVSDSYDIYNACDKIFGQELKDKILAREGKLVVRPDSGDPSEVSLAVLQKLWAAFGGTVNEKGYKVLNPKVGVIYGDGINYDSISSILFRMYLAGFSTDNIVFGMGGALLQQVNRDTQKFAFKCSAAEVNGKWVEVYKDPITDGGKKSKRGRLELIKAFRSNNIETIAERDLNDSWGTPLLQTVFENGEMVQEYKFEEVRAATNIDSVVSK